MKKNRTEEPLKTVPLEEITFRYICEKLDYNPVTGAGLEKYTLPDLNDWACDDRPRRWDILTYTEKAWTWGYIAYNKEASGGKASPSGWGDPEWEAGYMAAMRDTEERAALYEKMDNPESAVRCPRCGGWLRFREVGSSAEVRCPTDKCIGFSLRGI